MNHTLLLLTPRLKKIRNKFKGARKDCLRYVFIAGLVVGLWALIYVVFVKALAYFTAEELFGTIAAVKLLSMILVTFVFVLIISNIITTFSTYYLAEDLELIMSGPVPASAVYSSRFIETLFDSSWMTLVFGFPVFMAYGTVFSAPFSFYILSAIAFGSLLVMTTAGSILIVQVLVKTFPVRRLRDLFIFVGLLMFVGVYLLFRMMRPEDFLNPEGFASVLDYISVMSEPSSPFLPTTWVQKIIRPYIVGHGFQEIWLNLGLIVLGALAAFRLVGHYHQASHFSGFSKANEARGARLSRSVVVSLLERALAVFLDRPTVRIVMKESLLMARDTGRLGQLLLLTALVVVYLYNFTVLPSLDNPAATRALKTGIAFVNIGLAGFVLASLGVRFVFPAISTEGRAFWVLKGSPVSLKRILWVKFVFYLVPMLMLGLFLVIMTDKLLELNALMFVISTVTVAALTIGITSLSIGMGVIHADFKDVDPNRAFTGFGALLTMLYAGVAVALIIALEAYPVYRLTTAKLFGHGIGSGEYAAMAACFCGALTGAIYLIFRPLKAGLTRIEKLEI